MVRICPSILNADHNHLSSEINRVSSDSDLIHLDIMDNIFVPNITFSLDQSRKIVSESSLPVDAHLMVIDPEVQAEEFAKLGCASVTFHKEATKSNSQVSEIIKSVKGVGSRVGVAIKPETKFSEVIDFIDKIDLLLIMTVEPGFGGQSFMAEMMKKVSEARKYMDEAHLQNIWLQVDGGISLETIALAAKAGADTFVAGSAIYKSENPGEMCRKLRQLAMAD
jgi:ribulose-phosphate 3-epimerase